MPAPYRTNLQSLVPSLAALLCSVIQAAELRLEKLDLSSVRQGWGRPTPGRTVDDQPLTLAGRVHDHGLGSHAPGVIRLEMDGRVTAFRAVVGVDDETDGKGSVIFEVYSDGRKVFDSGLLRGGDEPVAVNIDLAGARSLTLAMRSGPDGRDSDHANWADAVFTFSGVPPKVADAPIETPVILTPPPLPSPRINGPAVYGVRPGSPFLYRIPCTGERPMEFSASGLPEGLALDPISGVVSGAIASREPQKYEVILKAGNRHGNAERRFKIVVGETLALTPPMGWNSWYIHYDRITQAHMEQAAELMVQSGMADVGYHYVNIDDCWMKKRGEPPYRDERGELLCNERFPDIKDMVERIHGLGLKAGIYSSPGPWTCAGYVGSWKHEARDAAWFARMGFDFLKYDWCSYRDVATGQERERLIRPYRVMYDELKKQPRDILHNICQYGMGNVWEWGREVGHLSRTGGDLGLEKNDDLPAFYRIGLNNAKRHEHAGPGYWNDPDYLLIGLVGDAASNGQGKPTTLTPNEQYSYMSMWSLMAAPLFFSGDMARLDPFTINVLCNPEVIALNQDALGKQARIVRRDDTSLVLVKPLENGSLGVGLFNLFEVPLDIEVTREELGLEAPVTARDCWTHRELGRFDPPFKFNVPRHGVRLLRLTPERP